MAIPQVEDFLTMLRDDFFGSGQFGDLHAPRLGKGNVWDDPKFRFAIALFDVDMNRFRRKSFIGEKEAAVAFYFKYFGHKRSLLQRGGFGFFGEDVGAAL
jgi:hypothetical protein